MVNNKNIEKYKKIVDELVKKSFPKLKGKKILLFNFNYQVSWVSAIDLDVGFMDWIIIFPKARDYSKRVLKGLLAHELSHYELILKMSFMEKIKFGFRWLFTKKGKAWFETAADKCAVREGYGKELYERVKIIEKGETKKELKIRSRRGYLNSKQIKAYAKKIGKW